MAHHAAQVIIQHRELPVFNFRHKDIVVTNSIMLTLLAQLRDTIPAGEIVSTKNDW